MRRSEGRAITGQGRIAALRRRGAGAWLLGITLLAGGYAAAIGSTGGFDVTLGPLSISSHNATRPAVLAALAFILFIIVEHRRARETLAAGWRHADTPATAAVFMLVAAAWTLAAGLIFNTFAAGGSDSYGYVSQALLFSRGALTEPIGRLPAFDWTNADESLLPLGYGGASEKTRMAPVYPPGLPLLMVLLYPLGREWMFLIVPLFGVVGIVCVWRLGTLMGDATAGAAAAVLLSVSPIFLYQLVQPMSDVPAMACWLAALVTASNASRWAAAAGVWTGLAILIRPNLGPLAAVIAILVMHRAAPPRSRRFVAFAVPVIVATAALLGIQHARFGSPLASGYGPVGDLFGVHHVSTNLRQYSGWLTASHTPLIWASLAAPLLFARGRRRGLTWALAAFAAGVWVAYLPYVAFQPHEWHYLRFLLPAIAVMLLFAVLVLVWCVRLLPAEAGIVVLTAIAIALIVSTGRYAVDRGVFRMKAGEQKYAIAGAYVREHFPLSTYALAVQHSGSLRLYAGTPTLRWDFVVPEEIDRVIETLRRTGFTPVLVGAPDEIQAFRSRFETSEAVRRMTLVGAAGETSVYRFE